MKIEKEIVLALINEGAVDRADFRRVVASVYRNHNTKGYHANIKLREEYDRMVAAGEVEPNKTLEKLLITKRLRSASGVTVITVLTKPYECPGKCIYCPDEKDVPKSYLSNEPAVMRAILSEYDPIRQVQTRLKSLKKQGHPTDKVEIIVIGGTFSYLPREYQEKFIKGCFDGLNGLESKNLLESQEKNEKAKSRCVGLTLETRPDYINEEEVGWFRYLGATRVELGVQSIYDDILKANCRGHRLAETVTATKLLRDAGFKICYHMMPNLYKSDLTKDFEMFRVIFQDERFKPDYIKIYPTMVTEGTALFDLWKNGEYKSYTDKELVELICSIKEIVPYWVRIMRTIRDIPGTEIISGSKASNLRQIVLEKLQFEGKSCRCIRCREVGLQGKHQEPITKYQMNDKLEIPTFFVEEYKASDGQEFFLSYESADRKVLYSLLRLRLPGYSSSQVERLSKGSSNKYLPEIKDCALIREVHTYGQEVEIGLEGEHQHVGYGKNLLIQAGVIAKENGFKKIAVISGVGVRQYYKKIGFEVSGTYLVKIIDI